jgi:hypothetical protein
VCSSQSEGIDCAPVSLSPVEEVGPMAASEQDITHIITPDEGAAGG